MNKWIAEFELEDGDSMPKHMDLYFMGARLDFHCKPVSDCIPIPNDATNGDVIKAMFPNTRIVVDKALKIVWFNLYDDKYDEDFDIDIQFTLDWWNAKYER